MTSRSSFRSLAPLSTSDPACVRATDRVRGQHYGVRMTRQPAGARAEARVLALQAQAGVTTNERGDASACGVAIRRTNQHGDAEGLVRGRAEHGAIASQQTEAPPRDHA